MSKEPAELRFVAVSRPGQAPNPEINRAIRSHVRRAILRKKKNKPILENLRFIDQSLTWQKKSLRKRTNKKKPEASSTIFRDTVSTDELAPAENSAASPPTIPDVTLTSQQGSPILTPSLTISHPFTHLAAEYVSLPTSRLDFLFKSDSYRTACEPLFDSSHVDATLSMFLVFPECSEEPLFFNALLYAILQVVNRGEPTMESLMLNCKTTELLNEKLISAPAQLSSATIGAIMLLRTTAYKFGDLGAHDTHSRGLSDALSNDYVTLTAAARRATFWMDLFAAVLINSERQMSHMDLPLEIEWQRKTNPAMAQVLPIGFVRHRHTFPATLLDCISDTVELQGFLGTNLVAQLPHDAKNLHLDNMQASIESRLALEAHACRSLGVVAEAVRLAVFLCCYCSWMETWNSSFIPCKLAEMLQDVLEPTFSFGIQDFDSIWSERIDILLWLSLISSSVSQHLDQGHVAGQQQRQTRLNISMQAALNRYPHANLRHAMSLALNDFIYSMNWLVQRCHIDDWFSFELFIEAENYPMTLECSEYTFAVNDELAEDRASLDRWLKSTDETMNSELFF